MIDSRNKREGKLVWQEKRPGYERWDGKHRRLIAPNDISHTTRKQLKTNMEFLAGARKGNIAALRKSLLKCK